MTTLSIIGFGAFGRFAFAHLDPHFDITVYDPYADLSDVHGVNDLKDALHSDIIILAVPIPKLENLIAKIAPHLTKGQLVMDIASVKILPATWMEKHLPDNIDIIATHPVFGPESGKNGIEGQNISIMNIRGDRLNGVSKFLSDTLKLNVIHTTPTEHDKEMAYVQGLTHLIAKILKRMDVSELQQTTKTYNHLLSMVDMIKNDSPELFHSIQTDNPYVREVTQSFFEEAKALEISLQDKKDA